jgi:hypothetical protein
VAHIAVVEDISIPTVLLRERREWGDFGPIGKALSLGVEVL